MGSDRKPEAGPPGTGLAGARKEPQQFDLFSSARAVPDKRAEPRATEASVPVPAPANAPVPVEPRTYKVSEIVRLAGRALEARFADVWIEGEISNLKAYGHCYFTLKDGEAQLPSVMFKSAAARLKFQLAD